MKKSKGLYIQYNSNVIKLMFLLFPLFCPSELALETLFGIRMGHYLLILFRAWNIVAILITILVYVYKRVKPDSFVLCALLFCGVLALSTCIQGSVNMNYMIRVLGSTAMLFLWSNICSGKKSIYYLRAVYYTLSLVSLLASASMYIYYPEGIGKSDYYLYGLDNLSFIYALHGFSVGFLYNLISYKKLRVSFLVLYAFIGSAYFYVQAATGMVIVVLCIIFVCIYNKSIVEKVNYKITLIMCVAIFLFFVVIQNFEVVDTLLLFLGKGITLNGRTRIWKVGLIVIKEHLLLGIGIMDTVTQKSLRAAGLGWTNINIGHLHNLVLEILCKGGIISFIAFIMLWSRNYKIMQSNEKHIISRCLCIFIMLSWLTCIFEFRFTTYSFWFLLIFANRITDLIGIYEHNRSFKGVEFK